MSTKNEWQEKSESLFGQLKPDILDMLQEDGHIHGRRYNGYIKRFEQAGVPKVFADRYIQNQLYDIRQQIAEQAVTA
jgi:hypothetical protein